MALPLHCVLGIAYQVMITLLLAT